MADYDVGYQKPPKHSQFKPGNRANPDGRRGKKEPRTAAESFNEIINQYVEYRDGDKVKRARWIELIIISYGAAALKGDIDAAANLLKLRANFEKLPDVTPIVIPMTERDMNAA